MSFGEGGADAGDDDQWVATHFDQQGGASSRAAHMQDIPDIGEDQSAPEHPLTEGQQDDLAARVAGISVGQSLEPSSSANDIGDIPDIPDIPDMDDEIDDLGAGVEEEDDPATAAPATLAHASSSSASHPGAGGDNGKLLSVRKYDCIITYDKYYQTPRMWLVGYDEHGVPLKPAQIFEDVSSDYAQKTVTIEPFPHGHAGPDSSATSSASTVGVATASIHPCKHASVMKKVIERMNASVIEEQRKAAAAASPAGTGTAAVGAEKKKKKGWGLSSAVKRVTGSGGETAEAKDGASTPATDGGAAAEGDHQQQHEEVEGLRVDQYMIIFLKFMASIVPAIEIDATQAL